jgi:hypothetical protein
LTCTVDDEDEEGDGAAEGEGNLTRTESLASASSFWDSLLRPHYLRLKREEEVCIRPYLLHMIFWVLRY